MEGGDDMRAAEGPRHTHGSTRHDTTEEPVDHAGSSPAVLFMDGREIGHVVDFRLDSDPAPMTTADFPVYMQRVIESTLVMQWRADASREAIRAFRRLLRRTRGRKIRGTRAWARRYAHR